MGGRGKRIVLGLGFLAVLILAGCQPARNNVGGGTGTPGGREMLADMAELLRYAAAENRKPPARPGDLAEYEGPYPAASTGLANGEIGYVWGAPLGTEGNAVLAWEKKAEMEGGWVLLQGGAIREMTAEEFKAAPRAKK